MWSGKDEKSLRFEVTRTPWKWRFAWLETEGSYFCGITVADAGVGEEAVAGEQSADVEQQGDVVRTSPPFFAQRPHLSKSARCTERSGFLQLSPDFLHFCSLLVFQQHPELTRRS